MIIDFHTHVFPSFFRDDRADIFFEEPAFESIYASSKARLISAKELLASMDKAGIRGPKTTTTTK